MPLTAHDLRYKIEESYPLLYAFLLKSTQRYLGPLKYDSLEVDTVIGYVIETLVHIGLLGGGDITPQTAVDRLSDAQFHAFLSRSVRNKAVDRLQKRHLSPSLLEKDEMAAGAENKADLQEDDFKDVESTLNTSSPLTREEALELAFRQAIHVLRNAYSSEIDPSTRSEKDLQHKTGIQVLEKRVEDPHSSSEVHIRITEEPLTAQNLVTIISTLTELHTKCWLIAHNRLAELIEYTQTHNVRFAEEADLIITRIRHNSPLEVSFSNLDPKNVADALVTAIDGVTQTKQRLKKVELENQEKAEQIRQVEKRAEQEYQAKLQELAIVAQKATQEFQMTQLEQEKQKFELEKQRLTFQIEQEKQKLELEKQQVAIEKERLELFNVRMNYLIEIANKMVNMLQPNADQSTRVILVQTMLPDLLQLQNGKGTELALPAPQKEKSEEK